MSKIAKAQFIEVTVGGVCWRMRRRSVLVMAEARGLMAVLGQVAGANGPQVEVSEERAANMIRATIKAALVEYREDEAGPWLPVWEDYTVDDLAPFLDALFGEFMGSGLTVDPTPPSCGA